jgi:serine/threonine-protein kinase
MSSRPIDRTERIGPYRLVEMLAHGATSCVLGGAYEGPAGFQLPVAIKTLRGDALRSPAHVRDFVFEARAAARVIHPGVVAIHALLEEVGLPLLVMERVSGWSLRAVIATLTLTRRRIDPAIAAALVRDAAHAAHALHEGGVIHRNLCPENLLVSAAGHVKLIDFGAASWEATEQVRGRPRPVIDPAYAAPETPIGLRGNRPGDVYTLGAVLHELCFGLPPPAPSGRASSPRLPDTAPDGLGAVIERALRYAADERFATAADLAEALDDVATDHGWRASPPIVAQHVTAAFTTRIVAAPRTRRAPSDVGRTRVRLRRARA